MSSNKKKPVATATAKKNPKPSVQPALLPVVAAATSAAVDSLKTVEKHEAKSTDLKSIANMLFDSSIKASKPYLITDENGRLSAFLRHRDASYINLIDTQAISPETVRVAIIGSIRYGRILVFDFMDGGESLLKMLKDILSELDPDLFKNLCSREILKENHYMKLVRDKDGELYHAIQFLEQEITKFKLVFLKSSQCSFDELERISELYIVQ